ncbi:hypothetical protein [Candidatus Magnetominusculus xianensis]|uniref:HEPN domain-containing protein n=1 Tax=Candidatus Magnetominusculus xianensis TaxID=1748249 RepID=A0ABR5SJH1_9BACT|nr:hypothetical protein [Candidatus Magnetominusculus xianensis]KWT94631.1 hypothetical protein ASN18_0170 [Candidatus Magnetominusculus xianensis]MBF0403343.1 hypothetical protein [Nitrospirota bacterium]
MFNFDYYKIIAEDIHGFYKNSDPAADASIRTSISRYYYYIFHKYKNTIYNLLTVPAKNELLTIRSHRIHKLISDIMTYINKTTAAGELIKLRQLRNFCDYDAAKNIGAIDYLSAKSIVLTLEQELSTIETGAELNGAFKKALSEIKMK